MRSVPDKVINRTCKKVADSVSNSISSRQLAIRYRHLFLKISAQDITIWPPVRHNHKCREYILRSPAARSETAQECEWAGRIAVGLCGLSHSELIRVYRYCINISVVNVINPLFQDISRKKSSNTSRCGSMVGVEILMFTTNKNDSEAHLREKICARSLWHWAPSVWCSR